MNRILLLSTGHSFFKGALWGAYDVEFPLMMAYLASFLEKKGICVDVVDLQVVKSPLKGLDTINFAQYSLVGINASLGSAYSAYSAAAFIKNKYADVLICGIGGFPILKDVILKECKDIDCVIYGDAEYSVNELVNASFKKADYSHIPGLIFRRGDTIVVNPPREPEVNLDVFPFPARDKFSVKRYFPTPGKYFRLPQFSLLSGRGCNWRCFFCPRFAGNKIPYRSPDNIVAEIDQLQTRYGAREISFIDDTFIADRARVLEIVRLLKKRRKKIYIRACSRIDTVDQEILSELKSVGLYSIGYGIESGVDEILKFNRKNITVDQIRKTVFLTRKMGLEVRGFFMLNMPGDTVETTARTVEFIRELDLDLVNVQITYPWPGTEMRDYIKEHYTIDEALWNNWECCDGDDVVFTQNDLSREYLLDSYYTIIKRQFLTPRFVLRWLKRIRTYHDLKYSFLQGMSIVQKTYETHVTR